MFTYGMLCGAGQVCFALCQLAAGFKVNAPTSLLSPYFKDIVQALLETVRRPRPGPAPGPAGLVAPASRSYPLVFTFTMAKHSSLRPPPSHPTLAQAAYATVCSDAQPLPGSSWRPPRTGRKLGGEQPCS